MRIARIVTTGISEWLQSLTQRRGSQIEQVMRRDWDSRAQENARYFIATNSWESQEMFYRSGEESVQAILADLEGVVHDRMTVLEIGCGTGRLLRPLARRFQRAYGVDVSAEMVRQATEELKDLDNVQAFATNGRDLRRIASDSVDLVISFIAFQHIPLRSVIESYIQESLRILVPGGFFKFQVHGREDSLLRWVKEIIRPKTTWKGVRFTPSQIQRATAAAGFEVRDVYFQGGAQYLWVLGQKHECPASRK